MSKFTYLIDFLDLCTEIYIKISIMSSFHFDIVIWRYNQIFKSDFFHFRFVFLKAVGIFILVVLVELKWHRVAIFNNSWDTVRFFPKCVHNSNFSLCDENRIWWQQKPCRIIFCRWFQIIKNCKWHRVNRKNVDSMQWSFIHLIL